MLVEQGARPSHQEVRAATLVAHMDLGYTVVLKRPVGQRSPSGGTADLLVDGRSYDVYTPTTGNPDAIIRAVAKKGSQAYGVVLDLSDTSVRGPDLGDVLARVRGTGSRLQDVIIVE